MQLNAAKEPKLFREKRIKALLYLNLTNGFTICLSFTQAWVLRSCSRALWHVDRKSSGSNHQLRLHNIYRFSIDNTICTCAIVKSQDLRCQAVSTSTSTSVYSVQLGGKGSQLRTQRRGGWGGGGGCLIGWQVREPCLRLVDRVTQRHHGIASGNIHANNNVCQIFCLMNGGETDRGVYFHKHVETWAVSC